MFIQLLLFCYAAMLMNSPLMASKRPLMHQAKEIFRRFLTENVFKKRKREAISVGQIDELEDRIELIRRDLSILVEGV